MDRLYQKASTCCFTGHRSIPKNNSKNLETNLENAIHSLLAQGVTTFISGGALGFDIMAAKAVIRAKEKHPEVQLVMALPCRDQHARWCQIDKRIYEELLSRADDIYYISDKYTTGCMHLRNRFMVEQSGFCISYFTGKAGGTAHTVNLAKDHGLKIINLAFL